MYHTFIQIKCELINSYDCWVSLPWIFQKIWGSNISDSLIKVRLAFGSYIKSIIYILFILLLTDVYHVLDCIANNMKWHVHQEFVNSVTC